MGWFLAQPNIMLSLTVLSSCVQGMRIRSSLSWILLVAQLLMLALAQFTMAPQPFTHTVLNCALFASATYFPWRGSRKEERRARSDYLANRELRTKIGQERAANKVSQRRLREIEDRMGAMDAWAGSMCPEFPKVSADVESPPEPTYSKEDLL